MPHRPPRAPEATLCHGLAMAFCGLACLFAGCLGSKVNQNENSCSGGNPQVEEGQSHERGESHVLKPSFVVCNPALREVHDWEGSGDPKHAKTWVRRGRGENVQNADLG